MPVGDCQAAFAAAALSDGIPLTTAKVPWLNQRGHLGLPEEAASVRETLAQIFEALGGRLHEQSAKKLTPLPGDFVHVATGTFIEIDEFQHFTSYRLLSLDLYPHGVALGFDLDEYRGLCRELSAKSDKYRKTKPAVGFGDGGRQRQRAYHDALRDLVAPAMGRPPVIRVAATDRDGSAAYLRVRSQVRALAQLSGR